MSYQSGENDKLAAVQSEVDAVRGQVGQAVDKAVSRGERLEDLDAKANNLENQASRFHKSAKDLKWSMCCKSYMHTAILITMIVIIFILVLWAAGAFDSDDSSSSGGGGGGGSGKRVPSAMQAGERLVRDAARNAARSLLPKIARK